MGDNYDSISSTEKIGELFTQYGDDQFISSSLTKLVEYKIQRYENTLEDLRQDLMKFEQTYQKSSDEFYQAFIRGETGDDMDAVEWGSLYAMYQRILAKKICWPTRRSSRDSDVFRTDFAAFEYQPGCPTFYDI